MLLGGGKCAAWLLIAIDGNTAVAEMKLTRLVNIFGDYGQLLGFVNVTLLENVQAYAYISGA